MFSSGSAPDLTWIPSWLVSAIDIILVLIASYMILVIIGENERRTIWMVRGFVILMMAAVIANKLGLLLLSFLLEKLVLGAAVAMAFIFQSQFRRFLELLGRGELVGLFQTSVRPKSQPDSTINRIVDAVKELSQNRTGALIILETFGSLDEGDFKEPGLKLNAEVSKELLITIFQTTTPLHDGAVYISGNRIVAAGVILPISGRQVSRQLGTRHRAAIGMTEKTENCLCIVVSEETGSISLAERGILNRPLTSSKLKELLEDKFSSNAVERDAGVRISRKLGFQGQILFKKLRQLLGIFSPKKNKIK